MMTLESNLSEFRSKIKKGPVLGFFSKTIDPAFIEVAGFSQIDFVILDMEHGRLSFRELEVFLSVAERVGIYPVVRLPSLDRSLISRALDLGLVGVQIPGVASSAQIIEMQNAAYFAPNGDRGVCRFVRSADYGFLEKENYLLASPKPFLVPMLEGKEALKDLDGILSAMTGDVLFVGPYDLAQSLGRSGQIYSEEVQAVITEVCLSAESYGVNVGVFYDDIRYTNFYVDLGVRFMAYAVDVSIFGQACRNVRDEFDGRLNKQ